MANSIRETINVLKQGYTANGDNANLFLTNINCINNVLGNLFTSGLDENQVLSKLTEIDNILDTKIELAASSVSNSLSLAVANMGSSVDSTTLKVLVCQLVFQKIKGSL